MVNMAYNRPFFGLSWSRYNLLKISLFGNKEIAKFTSLAKQQKKR